jgi:hypothetical protein
MHAYRRLSARMTIHNTSITAAVASAQPVNQPLLKLALDVHVQKIVVAVRADARAMLVALDRFVAGQKQALALVYAVRWMADQPYLALTLFLPWGGPEREY